MDKKRHWYEQETICRTLSRISSDTSDNDVLSDNDVQSNSVGFPAVFFILILFVMSFVTFSFISLARLARSKHKSTITRTQFWQRQLKYQKFMGDIHWWPFGVSSQRFLLDKLRYVFSGEKPPDLRLLCGERKMYHAPRSQECVHALFYLHISHRLVRYVRK